LKWFEEHLHRDIHQSLRVAEIVHREKTAHQDLIIFENPTFGRVLALDGVVQTTEGDEFIYHEMLAHMPIIAHGAVGSVLIIGGGDGGCLEEVLKHPGLTGTMVEIDPGVIELSRTYLPNISNGAFDDPRAEIIVADGAEFVRQADSRFDVVIIDSTDPIGPGEVLFSQDFYAGCRRCLSPGGILVTQNGVPFVQGGELRNTYSRLTELFADVSFYVAPVPTYNGGFMAFGWASDDPEKRRQPSDIVAQRIAASGIATRYYNVDIHSGAFALPNYVRELLG